MSGKDKKVTGAGNGTADAARALEEMNGGKTGGKNPFQGPPPKKLNPSDGSKEGKKSSQDLGKVVSGKEPKADPKFFAYLKTNYGSGPKKEGRIVSEGLYGLPLTVQSIDKKGKGLPMNHGIRTVGHEKALASLTRGGRLHGTHTPKAPSMRAAPVTKPGDAVGTEKNTAIAKNPTPAKGNTTRAGGKGKPVVTRVVPQPQVIHNPR